MHYYLLVLRVLHAEIDCHCKLVLLRVVIVTLVLVLLQRGVTLRALLLLHNESSLTFT